MLLCLWTFNFKSMAKSINPSISCYKSFSSPGKAFNYMLEHRCRDLLPFRLKSISEVRQWWWVTGSGLSSVVQFISMCSMEFRSGLCAGQSSSCTIAICYHRTGLEWQNLFIWRRCTHTFGHTMCERGQKVFDYCFGLRGCKSVATIQCSEEFYHTNLLVGKSSLLLEKLNCHATEKCIYLFTRFN